MHQLGPVSTSLALDIMCGCVLILYVPATSDIHIMCGCILTLYVPATSDIHIMPGCILTLYVRATSDIHIITCVFAYLRCICPGDQF